MSEVVTRSLDHYGLVMGMVEELEIIKTIDSCLPSKSESKKISHGMAVAAMIVNGLGYANKQLYLTPRFFEKKAVDILFGEGVKAEYFNKDTLGRTLDAMYAHGVSELYERVAAGALQNLGLIPDTVHLDSTSFHVDGAYANQSGPMGDDEEPGSVRIVKGYSRDHHPDLNQVVLNLIVEHRAGIPVWMRAADGNQVDAKAFARFVDEHLSSLQAACSHPIRLIADAALFTTKGMESLKKQGVNFVSRVPSRLTKAKAFLQEHDEKAFVRIDENYACIQKSLIYEEIPQQWVLYRSLHASKRENETLQKELSRISLQEAKRVKKVERTPFFCEADAQAALAKIEEALTTVQITKKRLIAVPKFKTRGRPKPGASPERYEYFWQITTASSIDTLKARQNEKSGLFILATNDMTLSPEMLLDEYKSQQRVERGFRFLKSPQFLSDALFLKNPERIEAMLMIMTLCLMVYAALEYKIRSKLKAENKTFPNQLGKPVQNPTARWIFENFHEIQTVLIQSLQQQAVANLLDRNIFILNLLGDRYWRFYRLHEKIPKGGAQ